MTLNEVVATGKKMRLGGSGDFLTFEQFQASYRNGLTRDAIVATSYEVEPDRAVTITLSQFNAAWNAARSGTNGIKAAGADGSPFYKKLIAELRVV